MKRHYAAPRCFTETLYYAYTFLFRNSIISIARPADFRHRAGRGCNTTETATLKHARSRRVLRHPRSQSAIVRVYFATHSAR